MSVPKLRFPEFWDAGEWEEKKLSAIAELTSSKRVHLSDYVPNGIPFFRGKEISLLKNNQIPEDILYISNEHYKEIKEKYGAPEIGDILITAVGTLGNVYCIRNSNKFYFKDGNLIWMKNISENSIFLEILLNVKSKDVLSSAIGSSQKALTMAELNKLTFSYPKKEEQQKIANCLSSIDELITAQTQKLDGLKTHKKGLMQQLFPAEGETVPELRFPEFRDAGEWVNGTLGDIATITSGGTPSRSKKEYWNGNIPWVTTSLIDFNIIHSANELISELGLKESSAKIFPQNTLLMAMYGQGITRGKVAVLGINAATNQACAAILLTKNIKTSFVFQNLASRYDEIRDLSNQGGQENLSGGLIEKIPFSFPTSESEQQKIADCLASLDELITAQTQKIDTLKAHKKGLMQQLFPSADEVTT